MWKACKIAATSLLLGMSTASAQPALDLPTALNLALTQNRDLAQRARAVGSADLSLASARADFGFSLRPDGGAQTTDDRDSYSYGLALGKKFLLGAELSAGPRIQWSETDDDSNTRTSWQADLRQPLFRNFGALVQGEALILANQRIRSAQRDYELQKASLLLRVVEMFESLIRLDRKIASDDASLQRLDKLYRLTRARERQGRATRVDTLRVELRLGEAKSRLETSREQLSSQQRDFAELLGQSPDTRYTLEPPPLLDLEPMPPTEAVRVALSNRLDYAQAIQDYKDTVRGEKIARRGLLPDLNVVARYESYDNSSDTYTGTRKGDLWSVGIGGDTDLNQSHERARLGQAILSRESAIESVRIRELAITREVQQQTTAYRRAMDEMRIAERNHQLALQRAKLARRLFEIGRGDNFSVTDAEEALTDAEDRRLSSRAEASVAGYNYLNTLGTLLEAPAVLRPNLSEVPP
ncbi:MAG: TolC family protein [Verrucomicrobia bacterium]|nr:TolC family protein [Verrucomicrobiota bacterium]